MKVVDAIAHILKAEGVEILFAYPVNPIIESAAKLDIRTIIVRQERTGIHMADAFSRMSSGHRIGVFCMQNGPGTENAFGGVAQAYSESVPMLILPAGNARQHAFVQPNFSSLINFREITKSCEQITVPAALPAAMRRAFSAIKNGRPRPALVEIPADLFGEELPEPLDYRPASSFKSGPDLEAVDQAAGALLDAKRPVIYAGQGIHYSQAWQDLKELAELLEIPVTTSLAGKSAFPENHPLSLGSGGNTYPQTVNDFLNNADVVFGIGCSFSHTIFGVPLPFGKTIIHSTLDPDDINRDIDADYALVGDAGQILKALLANISDRLGGKPRGLINEVTAEIKSVKDEWMGKWMPKLISDEVPFTPYRVIWDLMHTVDVANTIITHDSGSPRDQISPFWEPLTPLSYIGWGKSTQLGYGLGLAMGAKLSMPDKLCINVWGDAAIGFTGMDFETAVRERIPILSILFNNFSMAIEIPIMPVSQEKYGATEISGNYADMAKAFGGYGERVTTPDEIIPAIQRGVKQTQEGLPALLEFITKKEIEYSKFK